MRIADIQGLNKFITPELIEEAYWMTIPKLRLELKAFPVMINSKAVAYGRQAPWQDIYNSPVILKHLDNLHGVSIENKTTDSLLVSSTSSVIIGDPALSDFGFADYSQANKDHTLTPTLVIDGERIVCTNYEDFEGSPVMFWVEAYVYPHPVKSLKYSELTLDDELYPELALLLAPQALAIYFQERGFYEEAGRSESLVASQIKMFNMNQPPAYKGGLCLRQLSSWRPDEA
jgi:hypothetical protein